MVQNMYPELAFQLDKKTRKKIPKDALALLELCDGHSTIDELHFRSGMSKDKIVEIVNQYVRENILRLKTSPGAQATMGVGSAPAASKPRAAQPKTANIFPVITDKFKDKKLLKKGASFLQYCDGHSSLDEIAIRSGVAKTQLLDLLKDFEKKGVVHMDFRELQPVGTISERAAQAQKPLEIFFRYALADSQRINIPSIAQLLEQKIIGSKVHYWEGWSGYPDGNIIDFMEQNIQTSDFFVPVCTQAWRESINCKKEKDLAFYLNKSVVPVFEQLEFVPISFRTHMGVDVSASPVGEIVDSLYSLIMARK